MTVTYLSACGCGASALVDDEDFHAVQAMRIVDRNPLPSASTA